MSFDPRRLAAALRGQPFEPENQVLPLPILPGLPLAVARVRAEAATREVLALAAATTPSPTFLAATADNLPAPESSAEALDKVAAPPPSAEPEQADDEPRGAAKLPEPETIAAADSFRQPHAKLIVANDQPARADQARDDDVEAPAASYPEPEG